MRVGGGKAELALLILGLKICRGERQGLLVWRSHFLGQKSNPGHLVSSPACLCSGPTRTIHLIQRQDFSVFYFIQISVSPFFSLFLSKTWPLRCSLMACQEGDGGWDGVWNCFSPLSRSSSSLLGNKFETAVKCRLGIICRYHLRWFLCYLTAEYKLE